LGVCMEVLPESSKRQTCLFTATVTAEVRALQDTPRGKGKPPVAVCEVCLDSFHTANVILIEHRLISTPSPSRIPYTKPTA
jgi:ATP-dependent RNA helicase DDX49/DBP8